MEDNPAAKVWTDRRVMCQTCKATTLHQVLACHEVDEGDPGTQEIDRILRYLVLKCRGCGESISFGLETYDSREFFEWREYAEGWDDYTPPIILYPSRMEGRPPIAHGEHLPPKVRAIYTEAHAALCSSLPVLAGIGIRGIVETVCKDKNAAGKDLEQRINELRKLGHIPEEGALVLHSLRFMGNEAAHEVAAHPVEELQKAFEVVEYLLTGVYIIPKRAEGLPRPRGAAPAPAPPEEGGGAPPPPRIETPPSA